MSALDLTIDSVDNAAADISTARNKKRKTLSAWFRSALSQDKPPLTRCIMAGGTEYTDAKVAAILTDFLQPDTKTSLKTAIESLLSLIPASASQHAEVYSFGEICVEIAEQIPYHHPSQIRLVQLLHTLSQSPKFIEKFLLRVKFTPLLYPH